jgi:hypothetical protein
MASSLRSLSVPASCPVCGSDTLASLSVFARHLQLRYGRSLDCANCGHRESRDRRTIPEDAKSLFVAKFGLYRLSLEGNTHSIVTDETVAALALCFEVDVKSVTTALATGTKLSITGLDVELAERQAYLRKFSIDTEIERVSQEPLS